MLKLGTLVAFIKGDNSGVDKAIDGSKSKMQAGGADLAGLAKKAGAMMGIALTAGYLGNLALQQGNVGAQVASKLGITDTTQIAHYGQLAGKIYAKNFGQSLDEVGEALARVMQSTTLVPSGSEADIQAVTQRALSLTRIYGQDMPRVVQAAEQLIRNGLAKSSEEAFDIIARGFQTGTDKSEDWLDTLNEYPTVLRDLGLTGAESLGLINQALAAGARNSDVAADALKEFAIRGQDASKLSAEGFALLANQSGKSIYEIQADMAKGNAALSNLGFNAQQMTAKVAAGGASAREALRDVLNRLQAMTDPVARNAAAVALFGTKAEDLGDALFAMDLDTATQQLGDVAGAAGKAAEAFGASPQAKIQKFQRAIEGALMDKLAKGVDILMLSYDYYQRHEAILGPLVRTMGTLAVVLGTLAVAAKVYAVAQGLANASLWAFPATWIILSIVAIIAIIWLLASNWDAIGGWFIRVGKGIGAWFAGPFVDFFVSAYHWITDKGSAFIHWYLSIPGKIGHAFLAVTGFIVNPFIRAFNNIIRAWNALQFTIGGGSVLGIDIPSVTLTTPDMATIPQLARGAVVPATPGGRIYRLGEAGQDEVVAPEPTLHRIVAQAMAEAMGELRQLGSGGEVYVTVYLDGEPVRTMIRAERVETDRQRRQWVQAQVTRGGKR